MDVIPLEKRGVSESLIVDEQSLAVKRYLFYIFALFIYVENEASVTFFPEPTLILILVLGANLSVI